MTPTPCPEHFNYGYVGSCEACVTTLEVECEKLRSENSHLRSALTEVIRTPMEDSDCGGYWMPPKAYDGVMDALRSLKTNSVATPPPTPDPKGT